MSFRGQKTLQPGHPDARFSSKKLTTFLSCRPQNTGRQRRFTVKIKQIKRSNMVTLLFSVHTITEAKQYTGLRRAEPGRWSFDVARPGVEPPLATTNETIFMATLKRRCICREGRTH